jgi:hypothetical protein
MIMMILVYRYIACANAAIIRRGGVDGGGLVVTRGEELKTTRVRERGR